MKGVPNKLRANPLWKDTYELVVYIYDKIDEILDNFPDEKWTTAIKLRNSANDSLFYVAQSVGNTIAEGAEYDWGNARKSLFALQTMYVFAGKRKFIQLDPEVVVKIDELLEKIDTGIETSKKEADNKTKKELEPWLEKYRLWKEMQKDNPKLGT
ncbi:MAG TPA: four helix bundle protein [Candidatus Saccharimonadales bacterium]|nr:four helix bundle protein [Candidatus Saccharimonadales bacterium]